MPEAANKRIGDKIFIEGAYQYNAYYTGKPIQRFWHYTKLQEAQREIAAEKTDHILDAGCGSGLLAYFLAKDSRAEVLGVDANPAAIDFCQTRFQLPNLRFSRALIDDLPFSNNSFDKIVFLEVIEHLSREQGHTVLQRFYDLLKPGGLLVISTPNKKSSWPLIEYLLDRFRLVPTLAGEQHEYLYSGRELRKTAETAGFRSISRKTVNFLSPWLAPISWKLALKVHALEIKGKCRIGSLLLYTFKKPG